MTSSADPRTDRRAEAPTRSARSSDGPVLRGAAASGAAPADLFRRVDDSVEPTGLWAARAEAVAEEARVEGFRRGFADGRAQGETIGYQEGRRDCARAIEALDRLVEQMRDTDRRIGTEIGDETTGFAMAAVEAILARELAVSSDPGLEAIERCLAVGPELGPIEARLHPEDIKTLGHVERVTGDRRFTITPDPSLQRGDAVVTIGDTTVDGRLAEALDRLRDALR